MTTRVLYILDCYPQPSETYVKTKIEAVCDNYEVRVVTFHGVNLPYQNHQPFEHVTDLAEYVGGAGFFYDSINELLAILSRPYPDEMRARGFEQAKKSDIQRHKFKLTSLWDACAKKQKRQRRHINFLRPAFSHRTEAK